MSRSLTTLAKESGLPVRALKPAAAAVRLYPLFNGSRAGECTAVGKAVDAMIADGFVDSVYERHIGMSFAQLRRAAE
jgi:hypothetical protein